MKNLPDPFSINSTAERNTVALEVFRYQAKHCDIYQQYLQAIKVDATAIQNASAIPHLPISFFKTQRVITGDFTPEITFTSSGTSLRLRSGTVAHDAAKEPSNLTRADTRDGARAESRAQHHVRSLDTYRRAFQQAFELQYGSPSDYTIFALLPSYLEREGSSLILMAEELIAQAQPGSGFFLKHHEELQTLLLQNEKAGRKNLLLGVTFALLDFAEALPTALPHTIIMETGGMKGRRKELIREEVHRILKDAFKVKNIHSEYGMTELLSQAYSQGEGIFHCPPWMCVSVRDVQDPLSNYATGKGGLNIMDLANIDSCAFIASQDLGIVHHNGTFEVTGRFDHADVRGCNLMVV
ncbi:MAG: acyl transferase [Flavobacteriales bacterium]